MSLRISTLLLIHYCLGQLLRNQPVFTSMLVLIKLSTLKTFSFIFSVKDKILTLDQKHQLNAQLLISLLPRKDSKINSWQW